MAGMARKELCIESIDIGLGIATPQAEQLIAELITPEQILPSQILMGVRRDSLMCGEKALMFAVLNATISDYQKYTKLSSNKKIIANGKGAEAFILSEDNSWPFSFNNICDELSIPADELRHALITWKQSAEKSRLGSQGKSRFFDHNCVYDRSLGKISVPHIKVV